MGKKRPTNRDQSKTLRMNEGLDEGLPLPSMGDLRLVLRCYQQISRRGVHNLKEAADRLDVPPSTLYRAINKLERHLQHGQTLFRKTPGHDVRIDQDADSVFLQLEELVHNYESMLGTGKRRLRIRFAAGLTFLASVMPRVYGQFTKENPDVDIDLDYGMPEKLLEGCNRGRYDLVVSMVTGEQPPGDAHVFHFPMALMGRRDHDVVQAGNFSWGRIANSTVGLLTDRAVMPPYPSELFERDDIRLIRYRSFLILHSIVASGGVVTFSLPQLLTESQRMHLDVVDYPGRGAAHVALIRPKTIRRHSGSESKRIDSLRSLLHAELRRLEEGDPQSELAMLSPNRKAFHVTMSTRGYHWVSGDMRFHISPENRIYGEFSFGKFVDEQANAHTQSQRALGRRYRITGMIEANNKGQYHFVAQGEALQKPSDLFVVDYLVPSLAHLRDGPIVGYWIGRQSGALASEAYEQAMGYSVLMDATAAEAIKSDVQLDAMVEEFHATYGQTELVLPSQQGKGR